MDDVFDEGFRGVRKAIHIVAIFAEAAEDGEYGGKDIEPRYAISGYDGENSTLRILADRMSGLMLDTRCVLSMTDEDERIQRLREMERSCARILTAIGTFVDPDEITQLADAPAAPIIPYMHDQEMFTDIGEAPS
ncbi:hypothetical protein COCNU_16G001730 [Cocos nucifera]|uniref:Uncharacterized protein n=1 Tax=Cocos nucifera TaxID=13894 RepID=A0A8K0IXZ7_COCNU|nr:hypothetical protein COCNU_16G001730 [Cocos nucifera]